ncbi:MAG: hypothetical protein ACRCSS_04670 [Shewanella sp.]
MRHAIREILQNALDCKEYSIDDQWLGVTEISNAFTELPTKQQLTWLGESLKHDGAIGKYGEGLKLAMLILARENIPHLFKVGNFKLLGLIVDGEFCVQFEERDEFSERAVFTIMGDYSSAIKELLRHRQDFKTVFTSPEGTALLPGGKLFVNGLYVCDTKLHYSYDLPAGCLTLDRDRQAVNSFDLNWQTTQLLAKHLDRHELAKLCFEQKADCEYLQHFADNSIRDACVLHAAMHFGKDVYIARSEFEAKAMNVLNPKVRVVHTGGGAYGTIVSSHQSTSKGYSVQLKAASLQDQLLEFYARNKKHIRAKALRELKVILANIKS